MPNGSWMSQWSDPETGEGASQRAVSFSDSHLLLEPGSFWLWRPRLRAFHLHLGAALVSWVTVKASCTSVVGPLSGADIQNALVLGSYCTTVQSSWGSCHLAPLNQSASVFFFSVLYLWVPNKVSFGQNIQQFKIC